MKPLAALQAIKSVTCEQDYLNIIFVNSWYQEDIATLRDTLLSSLITSKIQEINIGADRENVRFVWNDGYFVLNFDYYSQSCWIEGQDESQIPLLIALHTAIIK